MPFFVTRNRKQETGNKSFEFKVSSFKLARGFTLLELLVVISIIAVLVATATGSWRNAQEKGRDGKRKSDLKAVQQAVETYIQANGKYPSSNSGSIRCNIPGDSATINWGSEFECGGVTYMQQLPVDSAYQGSSGYYYSSSVTTNYVLSAQLENSNDPELPPKSTLPCTPQSGRNFCVTSP